MKTAYKPRTEEDSLLESLRRTQIYQNLKFGLLVHIDKIKNF